MAASIARPGSNSHPDSSGVFSPRAESAERESASGRWEREAEQHHPPVHEDSATRSSRVYFFVILAIIAATFAMFLLFSPR